MTATPRLRRSAAALLGASALALTLAACGGSGSSEKTASAKPSASASAEATTSAPAAASTAAAPAATTATDADIEPAKQRVVEFIKATGNGDLDGACGMVYDKDTKGGFTGDLLKGCKIGLEGQVATFSQIKDSVTPEMMTAQLDPSGVVNIDLGGTKIPVVKGADGQLYIDMMTMAG